MDDLRDDIFKGVMDRTVTAVILAEAAGVIAGTQDAAEKAKSLGLVIMGMLAEGKAVRKGEEVFRISGNPKQIAMAEETLVGLIAKPSGIATAARRCVDMAGPRIQIVCGAWKKMPPVLKETIRKAVATGGACTRISSDPFIYLDKNYVRMLGGIRNSLKAVEHLAGYKKVVQINGSQTDIATEACEAAEFKADIIFIDSGRTDDLITVVSVLNRQGLREKLRIAFGGNVKIEDIDWFKATSVDILEIGRPIIDAPLLDLKMEVVEIRK